MTCRLNASDLGLPTIPSAPAQVPVCEVRDDSSLIVLRRCLAQLEHYRRFILEDYNDKLKAYVKSLALLDRRLEIEHSTGQINTTSYDNLHKQIKAGLASAGPAGSLMREYYERRDSYKDESQILKDAIKAKERLALRR
jgi:hypothetical protein